MDVVLISPYTSLKPVLNRLIGFLSFFISDRFLNYELVSLFKNSSSVLIIHGKADDLIPFEDYIIL